jgi:hypothetical protein
MSRDRAAAAFENESIPPGKPWRQLPGAATALGLALTLALALALPAGSAVAVGLPLPDDDGPVMSYQAVVVSRSEIMAIDRIPRVRHQPVVPKTRSRIGGNQGLIAIGVELGGADPPAGHRHPRALHLVDPHRPAPARPAPPRVPCSRRRS